MLKELFFMKNNRPLILISNDDGYQAKGINSLIDMVRHLGDIIVCAPDSARSGYSGAFSATLPPQSLVPAGQVKPLHKQNRIYLGVSYF